MYDDGPPRLLYDKKICWSLADVVVRKKSVAKMYILAMCLKSASLQLFIPSLYYLRGEEADSATTSKHTSFALIFSFL